MHWAKTRAKVKYDLALSGILNLPFAELEATISDIDLNGDNSYGFGPLVDALAAHADVPRDCVVTISGGTSMANHLAMAAAIEHGDEVLIEQPTYEPLLALAQYFSAQKPAPQKFEADPAKVAAGSKKADETLCAMCHLGGFAGQNEIPRVAGQNYDYIVKQLKDFKARRRTNDAGNMTSVAGTLSDEDIDNLANFIANLS